MKLQTCEWNWGAALWVEGGEILDEVIWKLRFWSWKAVMLGFQLKESVQRLYTRYAGTGDGYRYARVYMQG